MPVGHDRGDPDRQGDRAREGTPARVRAARRHHEFTDVSVPPKKYRKLTKSGTVRIKHFPTGDCEDTAHPKTDSASGTTGLPNDSCTPIPFTFGVMVAVPAGHLADFTSLIEAVQNGFGPAGLVLAVIVGMVTVFTLRLAKARDAALAEAARTARIQRFMVNLFQGGDEAAGPSDDLRVLTLLDRGVHLRELGHELLLIEPGLVQFLDLGK